MVRPKLSRALLQEFEDRRTLGVSMRCAKARGFQGVKRVRAELARRERFKRQSGTGWDDLSLDLINLILGHLTLRDILHLRLSGLGSVSVSRALHLQRAMRKRVAALERVYWDALPMQAGRVTPVDFAARTAVNLSAAPYASLDAVGRDMHALTHLDAATFAPPRLCRVPPVLARCARLESLSLQGHDLDAVPDAVLRLPALRTLLLNGNKRLAKVPDDIGKRLCRLRTIGLARTPVRELPPSLLATLNRNLPRRGRSSAALVVTVETLGPGYLERTVTSDKYPRLCENLRRNLLNILGDLPFH